MARIRRAICIAGAVCGLLSLVFAFGCERKKQESISVEKRRGVLGGQARHPETEKQSMRTGDAEDIPWEGGITLSREPRLGEIVTATLKITPSEDVCDVKVSFGPLQGVEVVGGDTVAEAKHISKGGTKEFSIDVKFISSPARIGYNFDGQGVPAMTTIGGGVRVDTLHHRRDEPIRALRGAICPEIGVEIRSLWRGEDRDNEPRC